MRLLKSYNLTDALIIDRVPTKPYVETLTNLAAADPMVATRIATTAVES